MDYSCYKVMFERALVLSRRNDYDGARRSYERCLMMYPRKTKVWISYAQMEKRRGSMPRCRAILHRGVRENPKSTSLCIALGLHEMIRENHDLGMEYLRESVEIDPRNYRVLRWKNHVPQKHT